MKMLQSRHTNNAYNPHADKCNCGLTRYTGKSDCKLTR